MDILILATHTLSPSFIQILFATFSLKELHDYFFISIGIFVGLAKSIWEINFQAFSPGTWCVLPFVFSFMILGEVLSFLKKILHIALHTAEASF